MMSRGSQSRYDFDDWADDRTTQHYSRRGSTLRMLPPPPPAPEPVRDVRAAQRRLGNAYYQPPQRVQQHTRSVPKLVPAPSLELEDNPFARPSSLGGWLALGSSTLALFAVVFIGRVLTLALTAAPVASAPPPPPAA